MVALALQRLGLLAGLALAVPASATFLKKGKATKKFPVAGAWEMDGMHKKALAVCQSALNYDNRGEQCSVGPSGSGVLGEPMMDSTCDTRIDQPGSVECLCKGNKQCVACMEQFKDKVLAHCSQLERTEDTLPSYGATGKKVGGGHHTVPLTGGETDMNAVAGDNDANRHACSETCKTRAFLGLVHDWADLSYKLKYDQFDAHSWFWQLSEVAPDFGDQRYGISQADLDGFKRCANGGDKVYIDASKLQAVFDCASGSDGFLDEAEARQSVGCFKTCFEGKLGGLPSGVPENAGIMELVESWAGDKHEGTSHPIEGAKCFSEKCAMCPEFYYQHLHRHAGDETGHPNGNYADSMMSDHPAAPYFPEQVGEAPLFDGHGDAGMENPGAWSNAQELNAGVAAGADADMGEHYFEPHQPSVHAGANGVHGSYVPPHSTYDHNSGTYLPNNQADTMDCSYLGADWYWSGEQCVQSVPSAYASPLQPSAGGNGGSGAVIANEDGMYSPASGGEVPVPDSSLSAGEENEETSDSYFGMPSPLEVAADAVGAGVSSLVQTELGSTKNMQMDQALRNKIMQLKSVLAQNRKELSSMRVKHDKDFNKIKTNMMQIASGVEQPVHPVPAGDYLHGENAAGDKMLNAPYADPYAHTKPYMPAYYDPVEPETQTEKEAAKAADLQCPYDGATGKPNKAYYLQTCGEWCWDHREKRIVDDMQFTVPAELDYTSSGVHAPAALNFAVNAKNVLASEEGREAMEEDGFALMKKGAEEDFAVPNEIPVEVEVVEEVPVEEVVVVEEQ